jgi:hypothetical protein
MRKEFKIVPLAVLVGLVHTDSVVIIPFPPLTSIVNSIQPLPGGLPTETSSLSQTSTSTSISTTSTTTALSANTFSQFAPAAPSILSSPSATTTTTTTIPIPTMTSLPPVLSNPTILASVPPSQSPSPTPLNQNVTAPLQTDDSVSRIVSPVSPNSNKSYRAYSEMVVHDYVDGFVWSSGNFWARLKVM